MQIAMDVRSNCISLLCLSIRPAAVGTTLDVVDSGQWQALQSIRAGSCNSLRRHIFYVSVSTRSLRRRGIRFTVNCGDNHCQRHGWTGCVGRRHQEESALSIFSEPLSYSLLLLSCFPIHHMSYPVIATVLARYHRDGRTDGALPQSRLYLRSFPPSRPPLLSLTYTSHPGVPGVPDVPGVTYDSSRSRSRS